MKINLSSSMPPLLIGTLRSLTRAVLTLLVATTSAFAAQPYLEDADSTRPTISKTDVASITQHRWPRIMMAETQSLAGGIEQYSKYQVIATQAGVLNKISQLQQAYPDLMYFRMFNPFEFSGYSFDDEDTVCAQSNGIPFNKTTAATGDCGVYAGHWLYQAGTRTANSINESTTTLRVDDASRFDVGEYVVVYGAPAGSFRNAEHMRVRSKNNSDNTLTVRRAYKSRGRSHASDSIIAQHVKGKSRSDEPRNWVYNLTTQSPRDGNGRRLINHLPSWLERNINRNFRGDVSNVDVSGILFDSDSRFLSPKSSIDANNDLVIDDGISSSGLNWHAQGLNQFYDSVRSRFPNKIISGGTRDVAGFSTLNGVQMEGFPNEGDFHSATPKYDGVSSLLARYAFQSRQRESGPAHSHVLSKTPSRLYPFDANVRPNSNRAFRFALGMTMLEDGYFAFRNTRKFTDVWFDEYSVDVTPGSSNYGRAVTSNKNNEARTRANTGWLGRPTGVRKRIYDDNQFRPSASIIKSGTFEKANDAKQWVGRNVTTSIVGTARGGSKGLRASGHQGGFQDVFSGASIRGPKTRVVKGRQYTFVFSAKAPQPRDIGVTSGGHGERFLIGPKWQRFVMSYTATRTGEFRNNFNLGRESTEVNIDSIHLFAGNANVFRRDFNNGVVVVNATPSQTTVKLGATFKRIKGTQDSINNGASLSSVTIKPYDSAILVRRDTTRAQSAADKQAPNIVITAPTLGSNSPIRDAAITVTDNIGVKANDVMISPLNTANARGINCAQINRRRVECSVTITGSGILRIRARDTAGNVGNRSRSGFQITGNSGAANLDIQAPSVTTSTPTKTRIGTITDTTLVVRDNVAVLVDDVKLQTSSTAGVTNFRCTQINTKRVNCGLHVTGSGNVNLRVTDTSGNRRFKSIDDYQILAGQGPNIQISTPILQSESAITGITVLITDDTGILMSGVSLHSSTTAKVNGFACSQLSPTRVTCRLNVTGSGKLRILAKDTSGKKSLSPEVIFTIGKRVLPKGALPIGALMILLDNEK